MIKKVDTSIEIQYIENYALVTYTPSFLEQREHIKIKEAVIKLPVYVIQPGFIVDYVDETKEQVKEVGMDSFDYSGDGGYVGICISNELQQIINSNKSELKFKIYNATRDTLSLNAGSEVVVYYTSKKEVVTESSYWDH